ncbi:NADH dehydrogenase [ubiquinone] 1 beta subcomplex subunit 8, mitochondrial [Hylaeus anthracinus]|uniref:NADH dehydrogenase [ubiquinone] 1 beta subcomplex subunit 8, mitochondrial n=1 Tax=Hylaeus anthracinus TaxID=313031 RepID=UPI0023B97085|nr:NADH dehydrogenase [ubiquinone] 1 beta subcomplex subunit 8, mitochondrial [Hylaeus anthracinus]
MALLKNFGSLSNKLLMKNKFVYSITRNLLTEEQFRQIDADIKPRAMRKWLPGLYPLTEEERVKAAEKYGLHPSEYKPYPDDEFGAGDYPDLPWIGVEAKDPYYPWDFPALRRNYDEPIHRHFDMMGEDRFAYGVRTQVDHYLAAVIFVTVFLGSFVIYHFMPKTKPFLAEKQYPGPGKVHYTFEPAK